MYAYVLKTRLRIRKIGKMNRGVAASGGVLTWAL
jgi:hypothetical protein